MTGPSGGVSITETPEGIDQQEREDAAGQQKHADPLYHYTSSTVLTCIADNSLVRATKLGYFSDGAELDYGLSAAGLMIRKRISDDPSLTNALRRLLDRVENYRGRNIFVCSFSTGRDQLTQWQAYCKYGKGVSIAFDRRALESLSGWTLRECVYEEAAQHQHISVVLDQASSWTAPGDFDTAAITLIDLATRLKHPSFRAEGEVRLVSDPIPEPGPPQIQFRPGRYTLVPFVEFRLPPLAIQHVIVGPTSELELSIEATAAVLRSKGTAVPVLGTRSTFREW